MESAPEMSNLQPQLPTESIELILDLLHDDNKSLKACSLVCKDWIDLARRLLFSRWTLVLQRHAGAKTDLLRKVPIILPFLRHLCVDVHNCGSKRWNADPPRVDTQNRVQSLHLFCSPGGFGVLSRASSTFLRSLSGVVNLSLENISFDDLPSLVGIVCAFPRLQALSIIRGSHIHKLESDASSLTMFSLSPHLVALELALFGSDQFLGWLFTLDVLPSFRSILLYSTTVADVDAMHQLITLNGSLEHLSLPIYDSPDLGLNLSQLTQLRSIQVTVSCSTSTTSLTNLLSNLSSPRLEQVAFQLVVSQIGDWAGDGQLAWEEVDALLQSWPFDGLKEVYMDFTERLATPIVDRIAGRMSQCRDRGILTTSERKKRVQNSFGMGADNRFDDTFGCRYSSSNHP